MMGAAQSSNMKTFDENEIKVMMNKYNALWKSRGGGSESQTELFRRIVPINPEDFSQSFHENGLNKVFTNTGKIILSKGFNCHDMYRKTQTIPALPVFNDDKYTVLHPLGEPGRDLGNGHDWKIGHLMVVKHGNTGGEEAITFNEMLPVNHHEIIDFENRINLIKHVLKELLMKNVAVSCCGTKVIQVANENGLPLDMGIRDFMVEVILGFTEDFRLVEKPGYILRDKDNNDISNDRIKLQGLMTDTFTNKALFPNIFIQDPGNNSQLLSHMHSFLLPVGHPGIVNYYDCNIILKIQKDMYSVSTGELPPTSVRNVVTPDRGSRGGGLSGKMTPDRGAMTPDRSERVMSPDRGGMDHLSRTMSQRGGATTPDRSERVMSPDRGGMDDLSRTISIRDGAKTPER